MIGPIEIFAFGFAEGRFTGKVLPEIAKLVDAGIIAIVDAVLVRKDADGGVEIIEIAEDHVDPQVEELSRLLARVDGILNDEDAEVLAENLAPGGAAAILCLEHTWVKPVRDALADAGGELLGSVRVPGPVVQEVLDAIRAEADAEA